MPMPKVARITTGSSRSGGPAGRARYCRAYGLPAIWLVWNNGGFISIRGQQRGYFGQELATSFRHAASGAPSRAWLRLAISVSTDP
jgi:hypothetical protein